MSEYDNTNRGVLFKNDRKETENHPDYTGSLNVEGEERYLSAWLKKSKNGNTFMSISLGKAKHEKAKHVKEKMQPAIFEDDQDLPF